MPDFNPFDMDRDGDGIDFLGFDYLMRHVLRPDKDEQEGDARNASCAEDEALDEWDHVEETGADYQSWDSSASWDAYDRPRPTGTPKPVQHHRDCRDTRSSSGEEEDSAEAHEERV